MEARVNDFMSRSPLNDMNQTLEERRRSRVMERLRIEQEASRIEDRNERYAFYWLAQTRIAEMQTQFYSSYFPQELSSSSSRSPNLLDETDEFDPAVECSVCLISLEKPVIKLQCNHFFHKGCIKRWFQEKNTCPYCRFIQNWTLKTILQITIAQNWFSSKFSSVLMFINKYEIIIGCYYPSLFIQSLITQVIPNSLP